MLDFLLHLDTSLGALLQTYGTAVYGILFLIIFVETGLVVMPFLPGDSLLFAAAAFAALGALNPWILFLLLSVAAIVGDSVNYWVGRKFGAYVMKHGKLLGIPMKRERLAYTHGFFERYGGKTIIFARFLPIVRTFAPFVAGVGSMSYARFMLYNVVGGVSWVAIFLLLGYFFGNLPAVRENFMLVIVGIIVVSFLPSVFEVLRALWKRRSAAS